jgi:hypothetical protein
MVLATVEVGAETWWDCAAWVPSRPMPERARVTISAAAIIKRRIKAHPPFGLYNITCGKRGERSFSWNEYNREMD